MARLRKGAGEQTGTIKFLKGKAPPWGRKKQTVRHSPPKRRAKFSGTIVEERGRRKARGGESAQPFRYFGGECVRGAILIGGVGVTPKE